MPIFWDMIWPYRKIVMVQTNTNRTRSIRLAILFESGRCFHTRK
jgi:hypothetical protein